MIQHNRPIHLHVRLLEALLPQKSSFHTVGHLHRLTDEWEILQQRVIAFMEQFKGGSQKLGRYVGLSPELINSLATTTRH